MLSYEEMKKKVFVKGSAPNGYFGDRVDLGFAFHENKILCVAECGYYNSGLPDVIDENEALWILNNHPLAEIYKVDNQKT